MQAQIAVNMKNRHGNGLAFTGPVDLLALCTLCFLIISPAF